MANNSFGLIIATHSSLSKAYVDALELILNVSKSDIDTISFEVGDEIKDFENRLSYLINNKYNSQDVLVLVDILGGTPYNIATKFLSSNVKIITGINLPLVLEIEINRENNINLNNINIQKIIDSSKKDLLCINNILSNKREDKEND